MTGGMFIVLDLFLAIHVIYFLGQYVRTCVLLGIYVTKLDSVPLIFLLLLLPPSVRVSHADHVFDRCFVFVFFFLFFFFTGFQSSVLGWWRCFGRWFLKGMSADVGCCSPAAPSLSSLAP